MSDNTNVEPDDRNVSDTPGSTSESDVDSDSAADVSPDQPETTDSRGMPVDNPSGG